MHERGVDLHPREVLTRDPPDSGPPSSRRFPTYTSGMNDTQTATSTVIEHDPISRYIVDLLRQADGEAVERALAGSVMYPFARAAQLRGDGGDVDDRPEWRRVNQPTSNLRAIETRRTPYVPHRTPNPTI